MSLESFTIINTRPRHQAENLNQLLQALGAHTINIPTLEIKSTHVSKTKLLCEQLSNFDIAIFVSANSALFSCNYWPRPFPIQTIIAIGTGSEKALRTCGISTIILPSQFSSEGILELSELRSVENKKIIIFCGEKSKPLLNATLSQRGAVVTQCECYRRVCPEPNKKMLALLESEKINAIVSTSNESLINLNVLFVHHPFIKKIPLVVISSSMEALAKIQGWEKIIVSPRANDEGIVKTLTTLR